MRSLGLGFVDMGVDDTIVYRKAVSDILAEKPDVVVGITHNGNIMASKINPSSRTC